MLDRTTEVNCLGGKVQLLLRPKVRGVAEVASELLVFVRASELRRFCGPSVGHGDVQLGRGDYPFLLSCSVLAATICL